MLETKFLRNLLSSFVIFSPLANPYTVIVKAIEILNDVAVYVLLLCHITLCYIIANCVILYLNLLDSISFILFH